MTYHYQSGYAKDSPRFKIAYWSKDDRWKPSLHIHWRWRGISHWFCLFLPEWLP